MEVALKLVYQYHCERGENRAPAGDLAAAELPRQHPGDAGDLGQSAAPVGLRAGAGPGGVRLAVLRVPRPASGGVAGGVRAAAGRRAGGQDPRGRPAPGGGVHRRDGGRLDQRRGARGARLLHQAEGGLRALRRADAAGRGDGRPRPHRPPLRLLRGRRGAGPGGGRQGAGRRLPADLGADGLRADARHPRRRLGGAAERPDPRQPPAGLRGGAGGAAHHRRGGVAGQRPGPWRAAAPRARRAVRRHRLGGRHPRAGGCSSGWSS